MSDDSSDFDDVQTEKTEKDRDQAGVDEKDNFMSSSEESDEEEKQEDEDQPKDESDQDSDIEGIVSNSGIEISRISHPAFTLLSVLFQNKKKSNSRSNTPTEELKVVARAFICLFVDFAYLTTDAYSIYLHTYDNPYLGQGTIDNSIETSSRRTFPVAIRIK